MLTAATVPTKVQGLLVLGRNLKAEKQDAATHTAATTSLLTRPRGLRLATSPTINLNAKRCVT